MPPKPKLTIKKNTAFRVQACRFKRTKNSDYEYGFAKVKYYGIHDIEWIVDTNGKVLKEIWDYHLYQDSLGHMGQVGMNEI